MERKIVLRKWLALLLSGVVSLTGSAYEDGEEEQYEFEEMQDSKTKTEATATASEATSSTY